MMKFICGCNLEDKKRWGEIRRDEQGFIVCPEHGMREYGWITEQDIKRGVLTIPRAIGSE